MREFSSLLLEQRTTYKSSVLPWLLFDKRGKKIKPIHPSTTFTRVQIFSSQILLAPAQNHRPSTRSPSASIAAGFPDAGRPWIARSSPPAARRAPTPRPTHDAEGLVCCCCCCCSEDLESEGEKGVHGGVLVKGGGGCWKLERGLVGCSLTDIYFVRVFFLLDGVCLRSFWLC